MTTDRPVSVEQMCRDLLTAAVRIDRSVEPRIPLCCHDSYGPDPQARSSGELVAMANLLAKYLADARARATRCGNCGDVFTCSC